MKKIYEAWWDATESSITFGRTDQIEDYRARKLLSERAILLHRIDADTSEEAYAVHYIKLGYEPYRPMGRATDCPNRCGAKFYPEGSGECPNCGTIA